MTFLLSVLCSPWLCPWHRQSMGCVYGHATINNCQHTRQAPPYQEGCSISRPWREEEAHHSRGVWVSCGCYNSTEPITLPMWVSCGYNKKQRAQHCPGVWVSCGCYNKHRTHHSRGVLSLMRLLLQQAQSNTVLVWVSCRCYKKHTAKVVGQLNFIQSVETRRLRLKSPAVWVLVKAIFHGLQTLLSHHGLASPGLGACSQKESGEHSGVFLLTH